MTRTTTKTVALTGGGPVVRVAPAVEALGTLRVDRLETVGGGTGPAFRRVALFTIDRGPGGRPTGLVWGGLAAVVRGLLKQAGVRVDDRTGQPAPSWVERVETGAVPDPAVPRFVGRHDRGVVRYDPGMVRPLVLAAAVCRACPLARVVVVARRRADARRLVRVLRGAGIEAAIVTGKGQSRGRRRVTGLTSGAAGRAAVGETGEDTCGIDQADLVLVLDPLHLTWTDPLTAPPAQPPGPGVVNSPRGTMELLANVRADARVFGLLPVGRKMSPFEQARLWQMFGTAELVVPRPGACFRPVTFVPVRVDLRRVEKPATDTVAAKKRVWADPVRIRRLARVANLLAAGDLVRLAGDIPAVAAALTAPGPRSVLVLADGLDQAKRLIEKLPGSVAVAGVDDPALDRVVPAGPASFDKARVVATPLGLERLAEIKFDVVVRADPGAGLPPLPPAAYESEDADPAPLLVVDADDRGSTAAASWSRSRKRAYRTAGWHRAGADPDAEAWGRFRVLVLEREERP